jgi:hypothetical protein
MNEVQQFNKFYFTGDKFQRFHIHTAMNTSKNQCIADNKYIKDPYFYSEKFKKFTIRKYKNKYYVFINGTYKGSIPYTPFNGRDIIIGARGQTNVQFDHLSVWYLP